MCSNKIKKRAVISHADIYDLTDCCFIAVSLPLFFLSYFSHSHGLSVSFTFRLSSRCSLSSSLSSPSLSLHLPLLPPLWIVVGYRCQRWLGQSVDNAMPTFYTIIIGLPGCQHRSSWEIYFACQK